MIIMTLSFRLTNILKVQNTISIMLRRLIPVNRPSVPPVGEFEFLNICLSKDNVFYFNLPNVPSLSEKLALLLILALTYLLLPNDTVTLAKSFFTNFSHSLISSFG